MFSEEERDLLTNLREGTATKAEIIACIRGDNPAWQEEGVRSDMNVYAFVNEVQKLRSTTKNTSVILACDSYLQLYRKWQSEG